MELVMGVFRNAGARGIGSGDLLRVFNARGACFAGLRISDEIRPGVIQIVWLSVSIFARCSSPPSPLLKESLVKSWIAVNMAETASGSWLMASSADR